MVIQDDGSYRDHQWFKSVGHVEGAGSCRDKIGIIAQSSSVLGSL